MSLHDKEKARMAVFPQPFGLSTLTEITLQGSALLHPLPLFSSALRFWSTAI